MCNVYLNGKIVPVEEANISVLDRGLLYGDGVFESFRTYNRRPFLLEEHLKRLIQGAKQIKIRLPLSQKQLKLAVLKTLAANKAKEYYVKVIITRGKALTHGLDVSRTGEPTMLILVEEQKEYPQTLYAHGWKAIISSIKKADVPTARIKSLCYLDSLLAAAEARKAGGNEAFLMDEKGFVVEGSISNLFIVKHDILYTPSLESPILPGITRKYVIKLIRESAFILTEKPLDPKDLYTCDECFVTMSGAGIIPITRIWNKKIGSGKCGPTTKQLISLYQAETSRK